MRNDIDFLSCSLSLSLPFFLIGEKLSSGKVSINSLLNQLLAFLPFTSLNQKFFHFPFTLKTKSDSIFNKQKQGKGKKTCYELNFSEQTKISFIIDYTSDIVCC